MSKLKAIKELLEGVTPAVVREGEEAAASASKRMVPGPWQESRYKRITEELPIEFLEKYKGNALGKTDIEALKKSIQQEGLEEPLILSFDPDTKRIKLGEGNHRLEALKQLGYTHAPVRASRSYVEDPKFPQVSIKPSTDRIDPSYYPADMKPTDVIDIDKLTGIAGVGLLGDVALSPESAEASTMNEKLKLKDLLKEHSPSFGSKEGDFSSYDESEALPTEGMQGQGLATILRSMLADKAPPSEFEEGGGGIAESAISPIDFISPGMITAPAKALGRGALSAGKAGMEAVESGAQAFSKSYPELAKRLADNRGSIDFSKKAIKPSDTPGEMSLLDSIKLAAKRSKVRAPDMEKANIEREIQRNRPKDFFDKAKEKATQRDFENIKKSLGKANFEQRQKLKDAGFSDEEISELLSRYANDAF